MLHDDAAAVSHHDAASAAAVEDTTAVVPPQLREDVLQDVFARLSGRVEVLCACACVCTAWRDAASDARLWRRLHRLRERAAERLTNARLAALVARAHGGLERLDVSGCTQLSAPGLAAALAPQTRLSWFAAVGCRNLTARGIARTLAGKRLAKLLVRGVCGTANADDVAADDAEGLDGDDDDEKLQHTLALLRSLVRADADVDVCAWCSRRRPGDDADEEEEEEEEEDYQHPLCDALCSAQDRLCDACGAHGCTGCVRREINASGALPYRHCLACGMRMCAVCIDEEAGAEACTFCDSFRCAACAEEEKGGDFHACGVHTEIWACAAVACARCARRGRMRECSGVEIATAAGLLLRRQDSSSAPPWVECAFLMCSSCAETSGAQCCRCHRSACGACLRNHPGCMLLTGASRREVQRHTAGAWCHACHAERAQEAASRQSAA
jgi:hypothetical protein